MEILFYICIGIVVIQTIRAWEYKRKYKFVRDRFEPFNNEHIRRAAIAEDKYVTACKLVEIKRNGRINIFTFSRNDEFFNVETMGLLGDDVQSWRQQAGLNDD